MSVDGAAERLSVMSHMSSPNLLLLTGLIQEKDSSIGWNRHVGMVRGRPLSSSTGLHKFAGMLQAASLFLQVWTFFISFRGWLPFAAKLGGGQPPFNIVPTVSVETVQPLAVLACPIAAICIWGTRLAADWCVGANNGCTESTEGRLLLHLASLLLLPIKST